MDEYAFHPKEGSLYNFLVSVDGTVLVVAYFNDYGLQEVVYKSHKRKRASKFQDIFLPVDLSCKYFNRFTDGITTGPLSFDSRWIKVFRTQFGTMEERISYRVTVDIFFSGYENNISRNKEIYKVLITIESIFK